VQKSSTTAGKDAHNKLKQIGIERRTAIRDIENFFDKFAELARELARQRINDEFGNRLPAHPSNLPRSSVLGIADIGEESDPLTDALEQQAQGNDIWETVFDNPRSVGVVLREIYELTNPDEDDYSSAAHAAFYLADWIEDADRDTYLRELELYKRENAPDELLGERVLRAYNANLNLYSTIPNKALFRNVFEEYGGGIIMSATLEPLDQFTYETGLDMVEDSGRTVETEAFDLTFPEENRKTFVVPNYKFVKSARGDATTEDSQKTGTRKWYEGTLEEIGQTYGNIMFVLPSKREAYAMGKALEDSRDVSKRVYIDQGGDGVLDAFRASDKDAILLTYASGTLTTGVDYSGDDLHTVGVVGVSYPPTTDRVEAVVEVYEEKFDDGYKYGVTVPAIREARQAIGRPIRGRDEGGVRLFIDQRYIGEGDNFRVYDCLPRQLKGELEVCDRRDLKDAIEGFWDFFHMF
jgi:DNA excision repair protein ERCC-2